MKTLLKTVLFLAFASFAGCQSAAAQTPIGGDVFAQRKSTELVVSTPTLMFVSRGNFTLSLDGLAGENVTTSSAALGGAIVGHYQAGPVLSLVLGLGCAYDVSGSFKLSDLNTNSIGILAGVEINLLALFKSKVAPTATKALLL